MAKDTFIIYTSFYKPVSILSDKQLGRLFRAIFRYNLGEAVVVEEDIRMAFEFFKNQFEIDERKYQSKVKRNNEGGRRAGNPNFRKGNTNPYYDKKDGPEIIQDNSDNSEIIQDNSDIINYPYNDNVYDNDYVSTDVDDVVVDDNARERPGDKLSSEIAEMLAADLWQYEVQKSCHRTAADIRALLPAFETDCRANGITGHDSIKDAKSHFCNWIRKKDQIKRKEQNNETRPTTSADRRRQGIDTLRRGIVEELAANNGYPAIINPGGTGTGD